MTRAEHAIRAIEQSELFCYLSRDHITECCDVCAQRFLLDYTATGALIAACDW